MSLLGRLLDRSGPRRKNASGSEDRHWLTGRVRARTRRAEPA
ncbi:MAG TPA: hypothetical protein VF150_10465 [Thermoanaerobaculia bacterium]